MKLLFCSILLTLTSCATRNMWLINKNESGGIIAYQNYNGISQDVWLEDIKQRVQCPDAFRMKEWQRKSQIHQNSLVVPSTNSYTTNTNSNYGVTNQYGSNLFNINGNSTSTKTEQTTQIVPYTEEVAWVEHRYECDWKAVAKKNYEKLSLDQKIEFQKDRCLKSDIDGCDSLSYLYYQAGKIPQMLALQESICDLKNAKHSAFACFMRGMYNLQNNQNKVEAVSFFKKGCEQKTGIKDEHGTTSCVFYAAHSKKHSLLEENIGEMKNKCVLEDHGSCYDVACLYSIIGNKEQGFKFLRLALENGYKNWDHLEKDQDLDYLKNSSSFQKLLNEFKERTPASVK